MSTDAERKKNRYHFDRHTPEYREHFQEITAEMLDKCPVAWSDTYGGHWVAAGHDEVFALARSAEYLSNDHDVHNQRKGYQGITIPTPDVEFQGGFLEMDPPEQRHYRQALNPYLSPAAVARWTPVVDELVRPCLNEHIETGRIDFVDHLANVVPAVLTLAMLGVPLKKPGRDDRPDAAVLAGSPAGRHCRLAMRSIHSVHPATKGLPCNARTQQLEPADHRRVPRQWRKGGR